MTKVAIASVGGLVGQNTRDCLEDRRAGSEKIGINSTAAAGSFRCDRAYLAPPATRTPRLGAEFAIFWRVRPH